MSVLQQRSGLRQLLATSTLAQQLATPSTDRPPVCDLFFSHYFYSIHSLIHFCCISYYQFLISLVRMLLLSIFFNQTCLALFQNFNLVNNCNDLIIRNSYGFGVFLKIIISNCILCCVFPYRVTNPEQRRQT